MDPNILFIACGSMRFTPEQNAFFGAILLSMVFLWLISSIMAFGSVCFLLNPKLSGTLKLINGSILAICVLPVLSLFVRMWIDDLWTASMVVFGIPVLIIFQFGFLMVVKRKLRRKHESEHYQT